MNLIEKTPLRSLKNLPTTWGLRLKEQPKRSSALVSEKPPHHMGIKTFWNIITFDCKEPLKNLPTTWGLRLEIYEQNPLRSGL